MSSEESQEKSASDAEEPETTDRVTEREDLWRVSAVPSMTTKSH